MKKKILLFFLIVVFVTATGCAVKNQPQENKNRKAVIIFGNNELTIEAKEFKRISHGWVSIISEDGTEYRTSDQNVIFIEKEE